MLQELADDLDFSIKEEVLAEMEAEGIQLDDYLNEEMLAKYRAGADDKNKVLNKLEQEQKQIGITVIKEKEDKTELQGQEQHNIIFETENGAENVINIHDKSKTKEKRQPMS